MRIDESVAPEMFHGATISLAELAALRKIKDVVRLGRVTHLGKDQIQLQKGSLRAHPNSLYVDCSARPFDALENKPVFEGHLITPQMVRSYQPVFSASLIAHVELSYISDDEKNPLTAVVPPPEGLADFAYFTAVSMTNQYMWSQDKALRDWIKSNRLDGFSQLLANAVVQRPETKDLLSTMRVKGPAAVKNLHKLYNEAQNTTAAV